MIEAIPDMPPGTLGFRATGKVTRDDYTGVFLGPIKQKVESGEGIRLLFQVGPGFDKFATGALVEDTKTGWNLGVRHPDAWKRVAFVTDVHWMTQATDAFAWMMPGELKTFSIDEVDEAKTWIAA
ncbi:MAG: STAS/SEC14 domain-containing protein [Thermoleophilaceae bacterium]